MVIYMVRLGMFFINMRAPFNRFSRIIQFLIRVIFQLDIKFSKDLIVGKGTKFMHNGIGTVVHQKTNIGNDVMIYQGVTLGSNVYLKSGKKQNLGAPKIENNVVIYSGAVIVGPITIGQGSVIGANCVITSDIPAHTIVKPSSYVSEKIKKGYSFNQLQ